MRDDQMSRTQVRVGVTPEARKMNCTDEEARILLRSRHGTGVGRSMFHRLRYRTEVVAQNNRAIGWTLWAILGLIQFTIWNSRAALFFGTLGYWAFGLMTAGWLSSYDDAPLIRTGFYPLDMFVGNPLIMFALSAVLMFIGMRGPDDEVSLFNGLHVLVVLPSIVIAYLGTMVMGILFFISILFGADKMGSSGTIMMMLFLFLLPGGYLAVFKLQDEA